MIGLFLDDERVHSDVTWVSYPVDVEWYVLRRPSDFMLAVIQMEGGPYIVSFDHDIQSFDLLGNEVTGYDMLKYLVDYCIDQGYSMPKCFFHTMNPVGKKNMESYYQSALTHIGGLNESV